MPFESKPGTSVALYCIAWPGSAQSLDSFARSTSARVGYLPNCQKRLALKRGGN